MGRLYNQNHACYIRKTSSQINPNDSLRRSPRISDAKKAADKRDNIDKRKPPPEVFRAYVGNIHPLTTIVELTDCFERCDGLSEVSLRIAQGSAVQATPDTPIDDLDVQYAAVTLTKWNGLVQVMKMNGMTLRGRRLVIGLTSAILPEMDRIIYEHYHGVGSLRRKIYGGRPLRSEPTEIITEEVKHGNVVIWSLLQSSPMPITLV
ncbi:hypothetical protein GGU10DRAFT_355889 [Lentinula aff. detonsa]|uniref:RRM domain-containing protein n=1 Tax=Lentinula aff. detonsa TaxID=2804958 RepID=A0AA38KG30_9AGAR|nr:hypothetical protein GGU10DRAFT_355889 [Lentinula aff. detonsa]